MAKKDSTPTATPPKAADSGEPKKAGRKAGFSTKENDLFKANKPQPETKVAPQAKAIAELVVAAGNAGIKRSDLVKAMEGVVQTKQPQGRILSYYQKTLVDGGFVTITAAEKPAAKKEEAAGATA